MSNKTKGILLIITAAFAFTLMNGFVRLAGDLPSIQKSFFRNAVTLFFALGMLLKNKQSIHIQKENLPWLFMRSIFGTVGVLCNFYAVDRLILADASILAKLAPFFAVLFSWMLLKERPKIIQILLVIGAFIGSYFLVNPSFSVISVNTASLVAIFGSLCAGMAYTVVRKLGAKGQDGTTIVLFFSSFSTLILLPVFLLNYHPMSLEQWVFLLLAGLAATLGQFSVTNAYIFAAARNISVFDYSQVFFAAIMGFFLFGEIPSVSSLPGYLLILAMGILAFLYTQKSSKVR